MSFENVNLMDIQPSEDIPSDKILKLIDQDNIAIDKKKRGRPKKSSIDLLQQSVQDNDDALSNEEIILHLSLTKPEIDAFRSESSANQTSNITPTQNQETNENTDTVRNNNSIPQQGVTSCSSVQELATTQKTETITVTKTDFEILDIKSKDVTAKLQKYLSRINELSEFIKINMPMYYCKVSSYPVDLKLFDKQGKKFIPKPTKICCWYDTEPFEGLPTYLPEKYYSGEFYVFGCFCSFNCACAYNLAKNDGRIQERQNLLVRLFYETNKTKIVSIKDIEINPAGERELLHKFGGPLSITEFRENAKIMGRTYSELIPSFHPIKITYSENTSSKVMNSNILNEDCDE